MLILNDYQRCLLKGPFQEALNIKKPLEKGAITLFIIMLASL